MPAVAANIDSMRTLWNGLGTVMIEGTHCVQGIRSKLQIRAETLGKVMQQVNQLEHDVSYRIGRCLNVVQLREYELQQAYELFEECERSLWVAEAELNSCLSIPPDEDGYAPDCGYHRAKVADAFERMRSAQHQVDKCKDILDRARLALDKARLLEQELALQKAELLIKIQSFEAHTKVVETLLAHLTNVFNYDIPHIRSRLGYKIVILETEYLTAIYGKMPHSNHRGYAYKKSRLQFLRELPYDYRVGSHLRGEVQRDVNIPRRKYIRTPTGYNVGHLQHGINQPYNYRLEDESPNKSRGARHKR